MGKKIVLLTHVFPYDPPSEQFINDELKYISNIFDSVFIIPVSRSANTEKCRGISYKNIYIKRLTRKNKTYEVLKTLFGHAIFNRNFYIDLTALFSKGLIFNRPAVMKFFAHHTNSYLIMEKVYTLIKSLDIYKDDDIILYSYWLSEMTYSCGMIKDKLSKEGYKSVKAISRAHGSYDVFISKGMKNFRPCLRYENIKLDSIYSVSEKGYEYLNEVGYRKDKLKVSRIGTEPAINADEIDKDRAIFEIVSCSSIDVVKRVGMIANALLKLGGTPIKWTHFGSGPLFEKVKSLCETLPCSIDWTLKGRIPNQEIIEYYRKNKPNLFINVSSIEGIPVSIMEALSFGIPVIATDTGGTSEAVINNFNGYLLKEDFDADELSLLILKVISMKDDEYKELCSNSRQIWNERFNAERNYGDFVQSIVSL